MVNWPATRYAEGISRSFWSIPISANRNMNPMPETRLEPLIVDFEEITGVPCPCGIARRAFADVESFPATVHQTEISINAKTHYHKTLTETYYFLECADDARMELDGELIPVRRGMCIQIPPGVRHRAVGKMKILNIVFPKFDPADEHFD